MFIDFIKLLLHITTIFYDLLLINNNPSVKQYRSLVMFCRIVAKQHTETETQRHRDTILKSQVYVYRVFYSGLEPGSANHNQGPRIYINIYL